jgi:GTPase SAR1 family protein
MGTSNSNLNKHQILVLGLQRSGKTFFLKKLLEIEKKELGDPDIEQTIGYNLINFKFSQHNFDLWELGGDTVSRSFWPTFYRNLKIDLIVFMFNIYDTRSHQEALKELLILSNEEELKSCKIFIIFNQMANENKKLSNDENELTEVKETVETLIDYLRECPIHDFDSRLAYTIFDISKMKDGENKTVDMLKEIFFVSEKFKK